MAFETDFIGGFYQVIHLMDQLDGQLFGFVDHIENYPYLVFSNARLRASIAEFTFLNNYLISL